MQGEFSNRSSRREETLTAPLLQVQNLKVHFPVKHALFARTRSWVRAVDDVSFTVNAGETLGLVGESGCGKTTLGRAVVRLVQSVSGCVIFEGEDLTRMSRSELRSKRRGFQMVFQDPFGSLNPRMTVENLVGEALDIHRLTRTAQERRERGLIIERRPEKRR